MSTALGLVLVVFFLFMNAFFVVAEFALVRVRKTQLQLAAEEGRAGAKAALLVANNVNSYLSACQLEITLASLALGWLGEPAVSELIRPGLAALGMSEAAVSAVTVALGFAIVTALHIVAGELIPKSLAIFSTDRYARLTALPLVWFYRMTAPVMWLFNSVTNGVMKLMGHDTANEQEVYTGEEIQLLIDESTENGLINPRQNEFIDNIFDLYNKEISEIMTPRTEMVCFDLELPYDENLDMIRQYKYTRYPVCRGSKDCIEGFVHIKDLYWNEDNIKGKDYARLPIRTVAAVSEFLPVDRLMQIMQEKRTKFALVVDEYGGTSGIVTMSDIMKKIIGNGDDEYIRSRESEIVPVTENTFIIDGGLSADETIEIIGFRPELTDECDTAAGLMFTIFDRIPKKGDTAVVTKDRIRAEFEILAMEKHRIDRIGIKIEKQPEDNDMK